MDLMGIRRRLMMGQKKDYLKDAIWIDSKFINANGGIANGGTAKYTPNSIYLSIGTYVLRGVQTYNGNVNYRIHQYNANDTWIRQLQTASFGKGDITFQINITEPSYIKLSIAKSFQGTLTKL